MLKHIKQVCYVDVQVASEVEAQKDADNEDGINAHDARTSVVPEEVPEEVPGSCAGSVQGNSGAPMRVPGSGLRATAGKVSGRSTPWALEYWLCVCVCVCARVCVCSCVCLCVCLCLFVVIRCPALPHACCESVDMS